MIASTADRDLTVAPVADRPAMAVPSAQSRYFTALPIDAFFIGGGSLLAVALMVFLHASAQTPGLLTVAAWATWLASWPHFSATSYRLYSASSRIRQYPFTAFGVPLLCLLGGAGSLAYPAVVAPYFVKLFMMWSPFHFSGQTLGISLLYARRAGHRPTSLERFMYSVFIYGSFFTITIRSEASTRGGQFYGVDYPGFGIPAVVANVAQNTTYICGTIFLILLARGCWQTRRLPPVLYLLPGVTHWVWFFVAAQRPGIQEFVPAFHGLQYLFIAWAMEMAAARRERAAGTTKRFLTSRSARWYATNIAGGACLFYLIPLVVSHASGLHLLFVSAIFLSAVQVHHFFVDGVIWKLRNESVASPLLASLSAPAASRPLEGVAT